MYKHLLTYSVLFLFGCGGGEDGGSSGSNSQTQAPIVDLVKADANQSMFSPPSGGITELAQVSGYEIVVDILPLDLNADGYMDIVLSRTPHDYKGLALQALVNDKNGTFKDESSFYFGKIGNNWRWVEKLYAADLNSDGWLEIIPHVDLVNDGERTLPILVRQVDGSFDLNNNSVLRAQSGGYIPIDINADGKIDVLSRNVDGFGNQGVQEHKFVFLKNHSSGEGFLGFEDLGVISVDSNNGSGSPSFVYAPAVVDVNNDNLDDLVLGGPKWVGDSFVNDAAPVKVFLNKNGSQLVEESQLVFATVPSYVHVREMELADFNGNGFMDILSINSGYDGMPYPGESNAIYFNDSSASLTLDTGDSSSHNYAGMTHSGTVGDIDQDGDIDIVYVDLSGLDVPWSSKVRILLNDGNGNFTNSNYQLPNQYSAINWAATSSYLIDLNVDSYPELVLGGMDSSFVSVVLWNDGLGNFSN
ncbi:FG-GAP repeat domain-containing protein [Vibrio barjaei]|uniref:FG-GAP repeat domain-containing protein n=1 Tax=Vibrio barjaei TaxID=1676683 RepID=UPI002284839D|nr:VCBS repeat-containing protein [Vibrio barjaei]MCY9870392.1 VCBS repeat-containing protein [Vibrio barjaei]